MLGYRLFAHAVTMLFRNLSAVVRIGWPLILALVGASAYELRSGRAGPGRLFSALDSPPPSQAVTVSGWLDPVALGLFLVQMLVGLWVAVTWHRYVLLSPEHQDKAVGSALWAYLKTSVILAAVSILAIVLLAFPAALVSLLFAVPGVPLMVILGAGFMVVYVPALMITYRLSPALPSAALGQPLSLSRAWESTSGQTGSLFVLALLSILPGFFITWAIDALFTNPGLWFIASSLTLVIGAFLGISLLTTLYGYFIEKRELNV